MAGRRLFADGEIILEVHKEKKRRLFVREMWKGMRKIQNSPGLEGELMYQ